MVKEVKQAGSEAKLFSLRLAGMTVALSLAGLGVYAISIGRSRALQVSAVALTFAGVINIVAGAVVLYRVLMQKEQ